MVSQSHIGELAESPLVSHNQLCQLWVSQWKFRNQKPDAICTHTVFSGWATRKADRANISDDGVVVSVQLRIIGQNTDGLRLKGKKGNG